MNVCDLQNLFVGHNKEEDFTVLICAFDEVEAMEIAKSYSNDAQMSSKWDIEEFTDPETRFSCDYVLTYGDEGGSL